MKTSDFIARFIAGLGVRHAFVVSGGCIVHTIDSLARTPGIDFIPVQHEQAGAMAADAYARLRGGLGVSMATSGPGATNLLTGVCCSYYDSVPTLIITGQVPTGHLRRDIASRQIGFQETDVVSIFESVTKYAVLVDATADIRYQLEKAVHIATTGRPGPVLIDVCDDVQRAEIDPDSLRGFTPEPETRDLRELEEPVSCALELMRTAERPVVILGAGARMAGCVEETRRLVNELGFPVALTWGGMDILPYASDLVVGGFGVTSERAGNFAVQNADLILALGTRLDTHETGSRLDHFAREARKIVVDIDAAELEKYGRRGMQVDVPIHADLRDLLAVMLPRVTGLETADITPWRRRTADWKRRYPTCTDVHRTQSDAVNPYAFMDCLSGLARSDEIITTDTGGTLIWTMQALRLGGDQRLISAFNHSPMGYALPAAMGAAFATGRPVICITGDGGLQMNIQELGTIARHRLPVKVFVMNNHGYGIIKQTLRTWLDGRYSSVDVPSGLPDPDYCAIAAGYGIPATTIRDGSELHDALSAVLSEEGPCLCNVEVHPEQEMAPKLVFGRPIEDSSPLLPREEFLRNMIVKPLEV